MKQRKDYDIAELMRSRPHLFILGAGATKATIPNGDKYGRQSPVMENFMHEIGIDYLLDGVTIWKCRVSYDFNSIWNAYNWLIPIIWY